MCDAGQYEALALFLKAQAGPFNVVRDLTAPELANAGAAGAIATGTGQLQARNVCQLGSLQQTQARRCFKHQPGGFDTG